MLSHLRFPPFLRGLGLVLGILLAAPAVLADSVTYLYETKAQGELEPCG